MSSSPKKKSSVLKKVISKKEKTQPDMVPAEQRMTRFKSKAKTCSICLSSIEKQVKIQKRNPVTFVQGLLDCCQHEFCFACIEKWSQTENTCPMCKQRFTKIKKIWNRVKHPQSYSFLNLTKRYFMEEKLEHSLKIILKRQLHLQKSIFLF